MILRNGKKPKKSNIEISINTSASGNISSASTTINTIKSNISSNSNSSATNDQSTSSININIIEELENIDLNDDDDDDDEYEILNKNTLNKIIKSGENPEKVIY